MMVVSGDTPESRFIWFDYQQGVMKGYCLPAAEFWGISLDGKFAAFVHETLPHTIPIPKTTLILSLETGYVSEINKYAFLGWAQADK